MHHLPWIFAPYWLTPRAYSHHAKSHHSHIHIILNHTTDIPTPYYIKPLVIEKTRTLHTKRNSKTTPTHPERTKNALVLPSISIQCQYQQQYALNMKNVCSCCNWQRVLKKWMHYTSFSDMNKKFTQFPKNSRYCFYYGITLNSLNSCSVFFLDIMINFLM